MSKLHTHSNDTLLHHFIASSIIDNDYNIFNDAVP